MTLVPGRRFLAGDLVSRSRTLGECVHGSVLQASHLKDLGVVERDDLAGFNWSVVPVCLVELGYLTHPRDERLLLDELGQERLAAALGDGILDGLGRL
jgi:N-acetylmuramoyl-L-alanine amidase